MCDPKVTTTFAPGSELTAGQTLAPDNRNYVVKIKVTFAADLPSGATFPAAADAGVVATSAA